MFSDSDPVADVPRLLTQLGSPVRVTCGVTVKIRFESKQDDLIAFSMYHHTNSPASRRQRWFMYAIIPALFCIFGGMSLLESVRRGIVDEVAFVIACCMYVIFATVASIAAYFLARWYWKLQFTRALRKLFAEGSNRNLFGWRELELANNRLLLKTELMDSSLDLRAIERIVTTDDYTFVYIASVSAYIIPMNLYPEDEYRKFVAELRAAWENYDGPKRVEEAPPKAVVEDRFAERPR
jgi:hypothetical protein